MRRKGILLCKSLMIAALLIAGLGGPRGGSARSVTQTLVESMTPEEKVGQLFLVTFKGGTIGPEDDIYDLIVNWHISGVVLRAENDNFAPQPETLSTLQALTEALQDAEYASSLEQPGSEVGAEGTPGGAYVPLFIALEHDGGGVPGEGVIPGMTELPSQMAIGATWDPSLAEATGRVVGEELAALGFNMMLGPSLDVLHDPRIGGSEGLGVRAFGGDPFWVGEMGRAYVSGVHEGAGGRIAVIPKHFPGIGSSDRAPEEEVATIRKSLEELKQIDLPPFFGVTDGSPGDDDHIADGLLTSHIRYQGFQGSIRATTRPVSLDAQALSGLLSLAPLAAWRDGGGLVISDSLGSRAVRRFYDPVASEINSHLVARDAFLAGNDILILSNFRSAGDVDEVDSIRRTLGFFADKYREDPLFAERVDATVTRVLNLKLNLYGGIFSPTRVQAAPALEGVGEAQDVTNDVAGESATLIFPAAEELSDRLGDPPQFGERVVFFTDERRVQWCSQCDPQPIVDIEAMENAVQRLYGVQGARQIGIWTLTSFSTADLAFYLREEVPEGYRGLFTPPEIFEPAVEGADWLVFLTLAQDPDVYGSNALRLMLDRRPDLAQTKKVVVFSLDVPYDVDATDISKVDAYYALYAKSSPFVDVAARLLFQELSAVGSPPVNVPATDYALIEALAPDPEQVIELKIVGNEGEAEPQATPSGFGVGDVIHVQTGVIRDLNGHRVPDGTIVRFATEYQGDPNTEMSYEATTVEGVAKADVSLDRLGPLTITAESDPARRSELLQLNVQEGVRAFVTVMAPTPMPTEVPPPRPTAAIPTATATAEPFVSTLFEEETPPLEDTFGARDLVLGILGLGMVASLGVLARRRWQGRIGLSEVRVLLTAVVSGLLVYNYLAMGLPGSAGLQAALGPLTPLLGTAAGSGLGLMLAYGVRRGLSGRGVSAD